MRFLEDRRLYTDTGHGLSYARGLASRPARRTPERFHLYWRGAFGRKQAFAVKSFLATQDLDHAQLWLWLDADDGYEGHDGNPMLRPLEPFIDVRRLSLDDETRNTLLAAPVGRIDPDPRKMSNVVRLALLRNYGGTYVDIDVMFLRDFAALPDEDYCYQWSSQPYANTAVLRLRCGSPTIDALVAHCARIARCDPAHAFRFEDTAEVDLLVLPCAFFDPLWLHHDKRDVLDDAPFDTFTQFFKPRGTRPRPLREWFPGAFTYHWHNCWDEPEDPHSYFSHFEREVDVLLMDKLGVSL